MSEIKPWKTVLRERIANCRVFELERTRASSPEDATEHDFYRILSVDWVQVVPVTAAGEIVMIRQYRHGAERITLEIPGGLVDDGESPTVAGARELLEETGYEALSIRALGVVNPNPALFSNRLHAFVAEGVRRVADVRNTGNEHTVVELVQRSELPRLLLDGTVDHALVAATLWRYWYDGESRNA